MSKLYELARNAGQAAGGADQDTADYLRSLTTDDPEQQAGYQHGLAGANGGGEE